MTKTKYLLINENALIYRERWRLFETSEACLIAARKLGYGQSPFGELLGPVTLQVGQALIEKGGSQDVDLTMMAIEVEG